MSSKRIHNRTSTEIFNQSQWIVEPLFTEPVFLKASKQHIMKPGIKATIETQ
jgi:hypothetical protein